jgi:hypothetical protein
LDIWPGLDFTLHSDGNFGMAHKLGFRVAAASVGPLALCRPTGIELSVAMDIFPASRDWRGASRACCPLDGNCGHDNCVWIGLARSGLADGTVPGLGNFRIPVERGVLAAESESRLELKIAIKFDPETIAMHLSRFWMVGGAVTTMVGVRSN